MVSSILKKTALFRDRTGSTEVKSGEFDKPNCVGATAECVGEPFEDKDYREGKGGC